MVIKPYPGSLNHSFGYQTISRFSKSFLVTKPYPGSLNHSFGYQTISRTYRVPGIINRIQIFTFFKEMEILGLIHVYKNYLSFTGQTKFNIISYSKQSMILFLVSNFQFRRHKKTNKRDIIKDLLKIYSHTLIDI